MPRKTAQPFIHTNEEYVKLRSGRAATQSAPRETPERQAAGARGYRKPRYSEWTLPELRRTASDLGIRGAARMDRAALVAALDERDAALARN